MWYNSLLVLNADLNIYVGVRFEHQCYRKHTDSVKSESGIKLLKKGKETAGHRLQEGIDFLCQYINCVDLPVFGQVNHEM